MSDKDTFRFYRGRSMKDTFLPGDCLAVESIPISDIHLGDAVVYREANHQDEPDELAHRVMAIVPDGLVTRGDNNTYNDTTLVTAENLVGRVTHVQRNGKRRVVRGGRRGLLRARILRVRNRIWKLIKYMGSRPYHWLRKSNLIIRLWQPLIIKVRLKTDNGPLVKYICGGRTVARWWPQQDRFECKKPYDLVIRREDLAQQAAPAKSRI